MTEQNDHNNKLFRFNNTEKLKIVNKWMKEGYGIPIAHEMGFMEIDLDSYKEK